MALSIFWYSSSIVLGSVDFVFKGPVESCVRNAALVNVLVDWIDDASRLALMSMVLTSFVVS